MQSELGLDAAEPSPSVAPEPSKSVRVSAARLSVVVLTVLGFVAPVALYVWVTATDSLDVLRADQWFDVEMVKHSFHGTLSLSMLWALHSDNRIFFQNLVTLLVAHTAHFNVLVDVWLNVILLAGATTLVVLAHHRRSETTPWIWYCPFVIVMFSVAQCEDTLYGFQVGWFLVLSGLALVLFLLDRPTLTWVALAGAVSFGVIASYSSLQGLFVWPVGLALLLQRARPRRVIYAWVIAGLAAITLYFYNWNSGASQGIPYALHHPFQAVEFYIFAIGDILGASISDSPHGTQWAVFAFGVVVLGAGVWAIVSSGLRVDVSSGRPIGVALVWTGLLFAIAIAGGRLSDGLSRAGSSRYVTFDLLVVAGSYLVAIDRFVHRGSPEDGLRSKVTAVVPGAVTALLVALLAIMGTVNGINGARSYHDFEEQAAVVTANIGRAPDGLVESQLGAGVQSAGFIREMVAFIRAHHLSLFSTSAASTYAQQQIPTNRTPPTVSIANPTSGEHLHGKIFLVARASDSYGITKVEFELRIGQSASTVISRGYPTPYGYIGGWNTASVPNGPYFLRSVAIAPGGLSAASKWDVVEIHN